MTVYGFNNKSDAEKLKNLVSASSANSGGLSGSGGSAGIIRFKNVSGATVPPFGLMFASGAFTNSVVGFGVEADSWSNVKNADNADQMPVINGPDPVDDGGYGYASTADSWTICLGPTASPSPGVQLGADPDTDFHLKESGEGPSFIVAGGVNSSNVYGASGVNTVLVKRAASASGASTSAAFFYTGATGIPAAADKRTPAHEDLWKQEFDQDTQTIVQVNELETVYNHTTSAVGAEKMIQCKKINGAWFIDVEPCGS